MISDADLSALVKRASDLVKDLPESLQAEAFNRVFETLKEEQGTERPQTTNDRPRPARRTGPRKTGSGGRAKQGSAGSGRKAQRTAPTRLKDLNLRPKDKPSLSEFVAEKKPMTGHERKLVAVYYVSRILELDTSIDHVYSCFKDQGWKVPNDIWNSLRLTASQKAWLDTRNANEIQVAIPGENYIEFDMPAARIDR